MATNAQEHTSTTDILYRGHRELLNLGHDQPGTSFQKRAMRELGLLDDDDGVDTETEALVTIYGDGRVVIDLQTDA